MPNEALAPDACMLSSGGPLLPRIDVDDMSARAFSRDFVGACRPAMLLGAARSWRATQRWASREALLQYYGDVHVKVSEVMASHATGKPLKIELPLRLYVEHAEATRSDFPFYVFERSLEGPRKPFLDDFEQPEYFRDDLYELTEYTRAFFPMYRYLIIGVERTGSNLHVDPSGTGAWNALLCGLKRWALFPPGSAEEYLRTIGVSGNYGSDGSASPPAYWWLDVLPRLRATGEDRELGLVECVQRPGETIFVPAGWWHCVLNIGLTVAITQNFVSPEMLPYVWNVIEAGWPDFARDFAGLIRERRPDVALPAAAARAAAAAQAAGAQDLLTAPSPFCVAPLGG